MIEFLKYPKMKNSYAIEPNEFGKLIGGVAGQVVRKAVLGSEI